MLKRPVRAVRARPGWKPSIWATRWAITFIDSGRLVARCKRTNRVEAFVYSQLSGQIPLEIPRALFTEVNGPDGLCILEELPGGKPLASWTRDDAEAVLCDLARLHAAFWPEARLAVPDELPELEVILAGQLDLAGRGIGLLKILGGWPGVISPEMLECMQKLLADRERLLAPLRGLPKTLLHGDAWQPNWLLSGDHRYLLDWEDASRGPVLWDVMYFLEMSGEAGGCLPVSQEEAVQVYLDALEAALGRSLGEQKQVIKESAPALTVLQVLTRWPVYACDYLKGLEKFPWLAGLWRVLPVKARLYLSGRMAWAGSGYYQEVFERFRRRSMEVYGV